MLLRIGLTGEDVKHLQQGLAALGFDPGNPDGNFGPTTESAVQDFQKSKGLDDDGVAGKDTLAAYNEALGQICVDGDFTILLTPATPEAPAPPATACTWVKCPADALRGGYAFTVLRSDVSEAYNALYADAKGLGGVVTSAGGRRPLTTEANTASQSKTSMHYLGRAFDMAIPTGMTDPETDPFIAVADEGKWVVWCRSSLPTSDLEALCGERGIPGGTLALTGTFVQGGAVQSKDVTAVAFNFTELTKKHGFQRISARKDFWNKANVMAAEWWHFQFEGGLVPEQTTFGEELLKVYTQTECEQFVYWHEAKDLRFKVGWF